MEWRLIKTAPRDGTFVLITWQYLNKTWGMTVAQYDEGDWVDEYYDNTYAPSHWMELPPPPKATGGE